jgi:hypothetical protein
MISEHVVKSRPQKEVTMDISVCPKCDLVISSVLIPK